MSDRFSAPLPQLKLHSNDGATLYYPKGRLVRACRHFSDLQEDCGEEALEGVVLNFSKNQIQAFLELLETEEVSSDAVLMADYFDLDYLNSLLHNKEIIIDWVRNKIAREYGLSEHISEFAREKGLPPHEWMTIHYYFTHMEELREFDQLRLKEVLDRGVEWLKELLKVRPRFIGDNSHFNDLFDRLQEIISESDEPEVTLNRLKTLSDESDSFRAMFESMPGVKEVWSSLTGIDNTVPLQSDH